MVLEDVKPFAYPLIDNDSGYLRKLVEVTHGAAMAIVALVFALVKECVGNLLGSAEGF